MASEGPTTFKPLAIAAYAILIAICGILMVGFGCVGALSVPEGSSLQSLGWGVAAVGVIAVVSGTATVVLTIVVVLIQAIVNLATRRSHGDDPNEK